METAEDFRETLIQNSFWPINLSAAPGPIQKHSKTTASSEGPRLKLITSVDSQTLILTSVPVEPNAVVVKAAPQLEIVIALNGQKDQLSAQYLPSLLMRDTG